jgi:hypothetical protein
MSQTVQGLPSIGEDLSSTSSTIKNNKKTSRWDSGGRRFLEWRNNHEGVTRMGHSVEVAQSLQQVILMILSRRKVKQFLFDFFWTSGLAMLPRLTFNS